MLFDYSLAEFQLAFEKKLEQLLSPEQLGTFITVLANSMQHSELQQQLAEKVELTWEQLTAAAENNLLQGAPDDIAVFNAMRTKGINAFQSWEVRQVSPWLLAFNPLRALRPERGSKAEFSGLTLAFDDHKFHFDKPFLKTEILCEENFSDTKISVFYHKFPFIPYHLLVVPECAAHNPQWLSEETHTLFWELAAVAASQLKGFGLAYNSLGAGASINHLHAHGFIQENLLPVELPEWTHCNGDRVYPMHCTRFTQAAAAWSLLVTLHQQNIPYNLIYRPEHCYVIARKPQGNSVLANWVSSGGWYEVAGGFNLSDRPTFESLSAVQIEKDLSGFQIPV